MGLVPATRLFGPYFTVGLLALVALLGPMSTPPRPLRRVAVGPAASGPELFVVSVTDALLEARQNTPERQFYLDGSVVSLRPGALGGAGGSREGAVGGVGLHGRLDDAPCTTACMHGQCGHETLSCLPSRFLRKLFPVCSWASY